MKEKDSRFSAFLSPVSFKDILHLKNKKSKDINLIIFK